MAETNAVARIYDPHSETEPTIKELQRSGFDMNKLSIVGKDYHTEKHVIGNYDAGDQMKVWSEIASFWGGLSGLLFGSGFFFIPGIGPVIVFGPLVSWIIKTMEGAATVGEMSALSAGLHSIGISQNSIAQYETALKSDKFLVIAHGTPDDIAKARGILETSGVAQIAPAIRGEIRLRVCRVARRCREVRN
jgi:hypothetical protein